MMKWMDSGEPCVVNKSETLERTHAFRKGKASSLEGRLWIAVTALGNLDPLLFIGT